jgi:hypothetical protein
MKIKMTRSIMEQKKMEAAKANSTWELEPKPLVRSYFNSPVHRTSPATWLGIRACHKPGVDTFTAQARYAMG